MSDETTRKEILDLLARGKLTVEEAAQLLSRESAPGAPNAPDPVKVPEAKMQPEQPQQPLAEQIVIEDDDLPAKPAMAEQAATAVAGQPGWLRVRVRNLETGKNKVTVNIPIGMVQFGLRVANKFSPEQDIDFNGMADMIARGERGTIVEVEDEESNEHVLIYLD